MFLAWIKKVLERSFKKLSQTSYNLNYYHDIIVTFREYFCLIQELILEQKCVLTKKYIQIENRSYTESHFIIKLIWKLLVKLLAL